MIGSTDSRSSISGDGASTITAEAIAALVSGELIGDGKAAVSGVAPLDRAGAQHLSVLSSRKYAPMMATTKAGVVLVDPEFRDAAGTPRARVIVKQPLEKLLSLLPRLYPQESLAPGVASTARIGKGADLGQGVSIGEYAVIGANAKLGEGVVIGSHSVVGDNVSIGDNARLWPGVAIYPGATIGARTTIHSGARIAIRKWGDDRFAKVALEVLKRRDVHVLWFSDPENPSEVPSAERCHVFSLNFRSFLSVLSRCHLLVCNDSGPMHLANLLAVPVVAVFGSTNPVWFGPRRAEDRIVIRPEFWCRPCFDYCIFEEPYCLRTITPEITMASVREALEVIHGDWSVAKMEKSIAAIGFGGRDDHD